MLHSGIHWDRSDLIDNYCYIHDNALVLSIPCTAEEVSCRFADHACGRNTPAGRQSPVLVHTYIHSAEVWQLWPCIAMPLSIKGLAT